MQWRLTPAVKWIIILSVAVFVIANGFERYGGGGLLGILALVPSAFVGQFWFWQIFTYGLVHADVSHLFFNLLMLGFMGSEIEASWGAFKFLRYGVFCSVFAGLVYVIAQAFVGDLGMPMMGASAMIYGLLTAYGIFYGERVMLAFMIFPMKARNFVWVLAGIQLMMLLFSPGGGLSSLAHLSGMGAGFGYLWFAAWSRARAKKSGGSGGGGKKKSLWKKSHLKLVIDNDADSSKKTDSGNPPRTWH